MVSIGEHMKFFEFIEALISSMPLEIERQKKLNEAHYQRMILAEQMRLDGFEITETPGKNGGYEISI